MSQTTNSLVLDCDPYSNEFLEDPYPFYDQIREAGAVVRLEKYDVWTSARHKEVHDALANWEVFSSGHGVGLHDSIKVKPWRPPSIILEQDPPLHTRMRKILMDILTFDALKRLRQTFETEADLIARRVCDQGFIDGVADVAEAFPLKVFGDALGLPTQGRQNMLSYSAVAFNSMGPQNEVFLKSLVHSEEIVDWTMKQCAKEALAPGSFGAQIYEAADRGEATLHEATLLMRTFMTAGVDTTVNGFSNALMCFSRAPEQWQILRSDPGLARSAFEEAVRLESPVQTFFRSVTRPTRLGDQDLKEGERILLFLGGANRDPRQWSKPGEFDIGRRAMGHVGFGHGIHGCVGQMLARIEGEILLKALSQRIKEIRPTGKPSQRLNNTLRGLATLPLEIIPA